MKITFSSFAKRDFNELLDYLEVNAGEDVADDVQDRIEEAVRSLASLPDRGNHPREMERLGIPAYRELHLPPYRIIYEHAQDVVIIHAILDARRNVRAELTRRQLR